MAYPVMEAALRRRDFITLLGGAATAWPLTARSQPANKLPTIGVLGDRAATYSPQGAWGAAFVERLRELGWIENRTIAIEYRYSEGSLERVAEVATEFARLQVDIIVTFGGTVTTLKHANASTPIVFAIATDPIGSGLVASLARPGGSVTGLSIQATDTAGKRLELLRQVVPRLRRLAIIFDAGYRGAVLEAGEVQAVARNLGFEVASHEIRRPEDVAPALEALKGQADALYLVENTLINVNRARIIPFAFSARLPTTFSSGDLVKAGGLMSYGPDFPDLFRRAAEIVDKILRGTKPADIPVEQPTKFDFVINLKTAKALGLTVPPTLLATADEVIE